MNTIVFFRNLSLAASVVTAAVAARADVVARIDFGRETGTLRPALHGAGWAPQSYPRGLQNNDAVLAALNLSCVDTGGWMLANTGQRVIDWNMVFPLEHLDARDPKNYYFAATDHLLGLSRALGLEIFYRLGCDAENTKGAAFSSREPADFEKTAEVFAGIVRHYNKGWADGKEWNIRYWQIWNEPDVTHAQWNRPGATRQEPLRDEFVRFFVTVLKRLKTEFPEIKVGGPGLSWYDPVYFRQLLEACRDAGVAPDFISWHGVRSGYTRFPDQSVEHAAEARKLCDAFGFTKCELVYGDWHYCLNNDQLLGKDTTPAMRRRVWEGPTGHNAVDSAGFTLSQLIKFQSSKLDRAFFHGVGQGGPWGYMDKYKRLNKNYHALKLFGGLLRDHTAICASTNLADCVTALAVKSADGRRRSVLAVDYRGSCQVLEIPVVGVPEGARVEAVVLDDTRDAFPCDVHWNGSKLTLVKADDNSAAFLVTFGSHCRHAGSALKAMGTVPSSAVLPEIPASTRTARRTSAACSTCRQD